MNRASTIFFICIMILGGTKVFAADLKYGYINNISGTDNVTAHLLRGGKKLIPVTIGVTIYIGDKLVSKADNVDVNYCNNSGSICTEATMGMVFVSDGLPVTKVDLAISFLASRIWKDMDVAGQAVSQAITKGSEASNDTNSSPTVYLAAMEDIPQDIFLGKRPLVFQWRHGAPPFTIKIMSQQRRIYKGETTQQNIKTNLLNLTLGEYQLSITDKNGNVQSILFNVIKKPLFAEQLTTFFGNGGDNLKQYTRLGTIAMVDGGRYALEVYQQLFPISSDSSALMYLRKAIEAGNSFPKIKSEEVVQLLR